MICESVRSSFAGCLGRAFDFDIGTSNSNALSHQMSDLTGSVIETCRTRTSNEILRHRNQ